MQDVFSPHSAPQVRWNHRKSTYDAEKLRALFLPYGDILHISARKKRALVVFRTPESASEAMAHEVRSSTTDFFTNILDLESLFLIFFFFSGFPVPVPVLVPVSVTVQYSLSFHLPLPDVAVEHRSSLVADRRSGQQAGHDAPRRCRSGSTFSPSLLLREAVLATYSLCPVCLSAVEPSAQLLLPQGIREFDTGEAAKGRRAAESTSTVTVTVTAAAVRAASLLRSASFYAASCTTTKARFCSSIPFAANALFLSRFRCGSVFQ